MSILSRLFGSKTRPTMMRQEAPTFRSLLKARTPPWDRVAPIVIDAIFEGLGDTELFDSFVFASIEKKLITRYEQLGLESDNTEIIRAQISHILCQAGFREISSLQEALERKQIDATKKIGFSATNLFEPAIVLANNQVAGYIGMATIYNLFGITAKCQDYAKRGLIELAESRRENPIIESGIIPAEINDIMERQLCAFLE